MDNEQTRQLVESTCTNYAGDGQCVYDRPCPYFANEEKRCRYFETSVLPGDQAHEVEYWQKRGKLNENTTVCRKCDALFVAHKPGLKNCAPCNEELQIDREQREGRRKL
jgi:hypothetical protein